MSRIIKDKIVKIRRPHTCLMCGRSFPAGTEMNYQVHTFDRFQTVYTCLTCMELIDHFEQEKYEDGFVEFTTKEEMAGFNFKGTPEEYLEIKRAERRTKQLT